MTDKDIGVLKAEYLQLQAKQADQLSADELATITYRMGEILVSLQDAGADTYPTVVLLSQP